MAVSIGLTYTYMENKKTNKAKYATRKVYLDTTMTRDFNY